MKKLCSFLIIIVLLTNNIFADFNPNEFYIMDEDLSKEDLFMYTDLGEKMVFSNGVNFPPKNKMPKDFEPEELLKWASTKTLNIQQLHNKGYTGKGVKIAYIDQAISQEHFSKGGIFENSNIHYSLLGWDEGENNKGYHGNLVTNVIVGRNVGIAPDVEIFYVAHPPWLQDQRTHAKAIYKIIEINKKLPKNDKIRILALSDTVDTTEKYPEIFERAIQDATKEGIMVFTCSDNIHQGQFYPMTDRNDYKNVFPFKHSIKKDALLIPTTNTCPGIENITSRIYNADGGYSSATPYMVGLAAIGLQINPNLTKEDIVILMEATAYPTTKDTEGMIGVINPIGFVNAVLSTVDNRKHGFVIYNSKNLDENDKKALKEYIVSLNTSKNRVIELDVNVDTLERVYKFVQRYDKMSKSAISFIQIIGTSDDVPTFKISDSVDMKKFGMHYSNTMLYTDHFWTNLDNNYDLFSNNKGINDFWNNKNTYNLVPNYRLSRLLVSKGDFSNYFKKYQEYSKLVPSEAMLDLCNYSMPIFPESNSPDDFGFFIDKKMVNKDKILDSTNVLYRVNTKGHYKKSGVDTNSANLAKDNMKKIYNFVVNGHGQSNNIDRTIFSNANKDSESRESFINKDNVNSVLKNNYYNIFLWTCLNGHNYDNNNLTYLMGAKGKAINIISSSSITSNNGILSVPENMDYGKNNPFYLVNEFYTALYKDKLSYSESLYLAKKRYLQKLLSNPLIFEQNFANAQFNIHNAFVINHSGLIKPQGIRKKEDTVYFRFDTKEQNSTCKIKADETCKLKLCKKENTDISISNYQKVNYRTNEHKNILLDNVLIKSDDKNLNILIDFESKKPGLIFVFLQGDTPGLSIELDYESKGAYVLELEIPKIIAKKFTNGLAINLCERDFIFINKDIVDSYVDK